MNTETGKKKGRSFSLTDAELARIEARTIKQCFSDRNEYLLALVEADEALNLSPSITADRARVLRPAPRPEKFLEDIVSAIFPSRVRTFQHQWKAAEDTVQNRDNLATQLEVADALLEALLALMYGGALDLDGQPAFGLLPGKEWDALIYAVFSGNIDEARSILRSHDPSGLSAFYSARIGFRYPNTNTPELRVAEDPSNLPSGNEADVSAKLAEEHRAAAERKKDAKRPKPTR